MDSLNWFCMWSLFLSVKSWFAVETVACFVSRVSTRVALSGHIGSVLSLSVLAWSVWQPSCCVWLASFETKRYRQQLQACFISAECQFHAGCCWCQLCPCWCNVDNNYGSFHLTSVGWIPSGAGDDCGLIKGEENQIVRTMKWLAGCYWCQLCPCWCNVDNSCCSFRLWWAWVGYKVVLKMTVAWLRGKTMSDWENSEICWVLFRCLDSSCCGEFCCSPCVWLHYHLVPFKDAEGL